MILKLGSEGPQVRELQTQLLKLGFNPGTADGQFGQRTEDAVMDFQETEGLYADGIMGPMSFRALQDALARWELENLDQERKLAFIRVDADAYGEGYNRFWLRKDIAEAYTRVRQKVLDAGAIITSSGAKRSLNARVSSNRSATSFHYLGRALDLHIWSGMVDAQNDPYVLVYQGDRRYRVYARARGGTRLSLNAATYDRREGGIEVEGTFIDLTELFEQEGFKPIRARGSFFRGGRATAAEWWHFQNESGLQANVSSFGAELLKVYDLHELEHTAPWKFRDRVFKQDWF